MIPRYTKMINRRSFAKAGVQLNYIAPMVEFTIKNERFERWSVELIKNMQ